MPRRSSGTPSQIYQLKITLRDSKPPIWRRLDVPDTMTLAQLHHCETSKAQAFSPPPMVC
jgi:hypothetical protein